MKVFIESTPVFGQRTGVAQYIKRLVDTTVKLDENNNYTAFGFLFFGRVLKNGRYEENENLRYAFIRYFPGRVYTKLMKWFIAPPVDLLMGKRADVMLFMNYISWPTILPTKKIVAVYDLSYKVYPQYTDQQLKKFFDKFLGKSISKAAHIITISENSKQEITKYYGIPEKDISIVHPAVDHELYVPKNKSQIDAIKSKYNIKQSYILSLGTIEPRKNLVGLLNAFDLLSEDIKKTHTLVLAGGKGWLDSDINQVYEELSKKYDIVRTGYLPDEDLPALYSGAKVFVFPTFYEGFGMPPLEAMACGTPVIASNNSSLPEVVGDAALMVDAHQTPDITQAIQRVLTDAKLSKSLAAKGLEQAKKFTWEKSAKNLIRIIDKVGAK